MMTTLENVTSPANPGFLAKVLAAAQRRHAERGLRKADAGMTLLEVLIVLALISLIAGAIGVTVFNNFKRGQDKTAKLMINEIRGGVQQYMSDNSGDCPPNLEELVTQKFLKKSSTKDPWGKQFTLKCPGEQDSDGFDIASSGRDKQEGTEDDILSWK